MKGQSKAKAHFKVTSPKHGKNHVANGPAVPAEYADNLRVADRASSRAMRATSRRRR